MQASPHFLAWLLAFLLLYWGYCLFWSARCARFGATAPGFFLAGRALGSWAFACGATVTAFAGWLFAAMPGLILRDGLAAGYLGFAAIAMPVAGAVLMRRQWILGRRHGYVTAGEMFDDHYASDTLRLASVLVALLFAVPFSAMLLGAGAQLLSTVTGGAVGTEAALLALAAPTVICATLGGFGGVANAGRLQILLMLAGVAVLGLFALHLAGGFETMMGALDRLAGARPAPWGTTGGHGGGDFSALFAVSGVAQWTEGLGAGDMRGGPWTAFLVLGFALASTGMIASPAFSIWAFSARDAGAFAPQLTWAGAGAMGFALLIFVPLIGLGGLLLGASGAAGEQGFALAGLLPDLDGGREPLLPAALLALLAADAPWLGAFVSICVVVAVTAPVGAFVFAAAASLSRDVHRHFFDRAASDRLQQQFARVAMLILTVLAVLMALYAASGTAALAALTLPLAAQLLPAYLGVLWIGWFTRAGVVAGLLVGGAAVVLTDPLGQLLSSGGLPWGPWPWTIHAAAWGLAANLLVTVIGSAMTQGAGDAGTRARTARELALHGRRPPAGRALTTAAWSVTLTWVFFAIGPGIVLGNYAFGSPGAGRGAWDFAMPSIWAWQLIGWGLGVLLVWFLAYAMQLATGPTERVVPLRADVARDPLHPARGA